MTTGLPGKDSLLAACRGFPNFLGHPMLDAAGELAVLHQARECTPYRDLGSIDWPRVEAMRNIDDWARWAIPVPFASAQTHTHTMGQVVDQLAQQTVQTFIALAAAPDGVFQDAFAQLNELADAYEDLVHELARGTRRLPQLLCPW